MQGIDADVLLRFLVAAKPRGGIWNWELTDKNQTDWKRQRRLILSQKNQSGFMAIVNLIVTDPHEQYQANSGTLKITNQLIEYVKEHRRMIKKTKPKLTALTLIYPFHRQEFNHSITQGKMEFVNPGVILNAIKNAANIRTLTNSEKLLMNAN